MAWNGTGTFSRTNGDNTGSDTWQQDKNDGDKIVASRHDTHDQDLADGINACLAKNGENAMTGDLSLGGNDITNVSQITSTTGLTINSAGTLTLNDPVSFGGNDISNVDLMTLNTIVTTVAAAFSGTNVFNGTTSLGGTTTVSGSNKFVITTTPPSSASDTGTAGTITSDSNYIYICTATNTWKRVAIATW